LALWASGYVPLLNIIGYLLLPTAILATIAIFVASVFGRDIRSQRVIAGSVFVAVALAGVGSRWVANLHARETYVERTNFTAPLTIEFGAPIQITLSGPSMSSAGTLSFSSITARTPTAWCDPTTDCVGWPIEWSTELEWDQAHKALGRIGARAVMSDAPIRLSVTSEEQALALRVTTVLTSGETEVARSERLLPKEEPAEHPAAALWFWYVLESNLLTSLIAPFPERISPRLFDDFLERAVTVVPEPPQPSELATVVEGFSFEPPRVVTYQEAEGRVRGACAMNISAEGFRGFTVYNLSEAWRDRVASIPTRVGEIMCTQDALYTFGATAPATFMIERYDFDGTLRWRHSARFAQPFGKRVTLHRSSLQDVGSRVVARLNIFEEQYGDENGRRIRLAHVLLHESIDFAFAPTEVAQVPGP
jgi:hypothetical protein